MLGMKKVLEKAKIEESISLYVSSLSSFVDHVDLKRLSCPPASTSPVAQTYRCRTTGLIVLILYFWKEKKTLS